MALCCTPPTAAAAAAAAAAAQLGWVDHFPPGLAAQLAALSAEAGPANLPQHRLSPLLAAELLRDPSAAAAASSGGGGGGIGGGGQTDVHWGTAVDGLRYEPDLDAVRVSLGRPAAAAGGGGGGDRELFARWVVACDGGECASVTGPTPCAVWRRVVLACSV